MRKKFEFYCCGEQEFAYVDGLLFKWTERIPWKDRGIITCPNCFSDWDYVGKEEKEEEDDED
jgi:hypothetical protein